MATPPIQPVDIHSRRYLGNKTKLLDFISDTVARHLPQVGITGAPSSVVDIFSGTGSVAARFNGPSTRVLANDLLPSNVVCLNAWLGPDEVRVSRVREAAVLMVAGTLPGEELPDPEVSPVLTRHSACLSRLSQLPTDQAFIDAYADRYFTPTTAQALSTWRSRLPDVAHALKLNRREHDVLLAGILYTADRHALTFGHFEAYQKRPGPARPLSFLLPDVPDATQNAGNVIVQHDATLLASFLSCDVLYLDPPYNSRQYGAAYHVLDVIAQGVVPTVKGVTRKPVHHLAWESSQYCTKQAAAALERLVESSCAKLIVMSYSNMEEKGDGRSNAKISGEEIQAILAKKGKVHVVGKPHKAFSTGKTRLDDHQELLYVCHVGVFA